MDIVRAVQVDMKGVMAEATTEDRGVEMARLALWRAPTERKMDIAEKQRWTMIKMLMDRFWPNCWAPKRNMDELK